MLLVNVFIKLQVMKGKRTEKGNKKQVQPLPLREVIRHAFHQTSV